jgi:hypothetical protein
VGRHEGRLTRLKPKFRPEILISRQALHDVSNRGGARSSDHEATRHDKRVGHSVLEVAQPPMLSWTIRYQSMECVDGSGGRRKDLH